MRRRRRRRRRRKERKEKMHTCARCHVHHTDVMLTKLNVQSIVNDDL